MNRKLNNIFIKNFRLLIFTFFYFSILLGFFLDENSTLGAQVDFLYHMKTLVTFDENLNYALLNYHTIDSPTRISPVFLLYLFYLKYFFVNIDIMRFISLNIYLISPFIFYNCLKLKFEKINKNNLFIFSLILFVSASFRGNSIWPESSMLGLLFFLISILFFLKFEKKKFFSYAIYNVIFLSIAAYIRPSYSLFAIFFFIMFFREYNIGIKLFILFLINIFLSSFAFYYLFILDVEFISSHGLSFNLSDKFLIISSIILFYFLPFLPFIYKSNKVNFFSKRFFIIIFIMIFIYFYLISDFNYDLKIAGGGFFLHLSHFLFNSNTLFFLISFVSILLISYILLIDFNKNFLLILILFMLVPQTHIFHKYFDPILIICIPLLFKISLDNIFEKKKLAFIFFYFSSFYLVTLINALTIKF